MPFPLYYIYVTVVMSKARGLAVLGTESYQCFMFDGIARATSTPRRDGSLLLPASAAESSAYWVAGTSET